MSHFHESHQGTEGSIILQVKTLLFQAPVLKKMYHFGTQTLTSVYQLRGTMVLDWNVPAILKPHTKQRVNLSKNLSKNFESTKLFECAVYQPEPEKTCQIMQTFLLWFNLDGKDRYLCYLGHGKLSWDRITPLAPIIITRRCNLL